MANFRFLVEGVEDNNRTNDAQWSDWEGFAHVLSVYAEEGYDDEDITEAEAAEVIERAIKSNGASLAADLQALELRIKGQNFEGSWWNRTEAV